MQPQLSLIISTAQGKGPPLHRCLQRLQAQSWQAFETWVIDDGSSDCEAVVSAFSSQLNLHYDWRANDRCQARSRNLGAQKAQSQALVFIDADILLNPHALGFYHQALSQCQSAIFGYFGTAKDFLSPSYWFPQIQVQGIDYRFYFGAQGKLYYHDPLILSQPYRYAHGGNLGLNRALFQTLGGFDESYIGWGGEDIDFAHRLCQAGYGLDFSLDVWGEHQAHPSSIPHSPQASEPVLSPLTREPGLLFNPQITQIAALYQNHYMPQALKYLQQHGKTPPDWMKAFLSAAEES